MLVTISLKKSALGISPLKKKKRILEDRICDSYPAVPFSQNFEK